MKSNHQRRIEQFMKKAGREVPDKPKCPPSAIRQLQARLIWENAMKVIKALGVGVTISEERDAVFITDKCKINFSPAFPVDLAEIADSCADTSVAAIGTLSACGIHDLPILRAVDQSNLAKFPEPICPICNAPMEYSAKHWNCPNDHHMLADYFGYQDGGGKWIKPLFWKKPDLLKVMTEQDRQGAHGDYQLAETEAMEYLHVYAPHLAITSSKIALADGIASRDFDAWYKATYNTEYVAFSRDALKLAFEAGRQSARPAETPLNQQNGILPPSNVGSQVQQEVDEQKVKEQFIKTYEDKAYTICCRVVRIFSDMGLREWLTAEEIANKANIPVECAKEAITRLMETSGIISGLNRPGEPTRYATLIFKLLMPPAMGSPERFKKEGGSNFIKSMDARVWAAQFMKIVRDVGAILDEGFMIGWFANALMFGYDEACSQWQKKAQAAGAQIKAAVGSAKIFEYHNRHDVAGVIANLFTSLDRAGKELELKDKIVDTSAWHKVIGGMRPPLDVVYTNHRGETRQRRIIPEYVYYGCSNWHHDAQWLLNAFDVDKKQTRTFAMNRLIREPAKLSTWYKSQPSGYKSVDIPDWFEGALEAWQKKTFIPASGGDPGSVIRNVSVDAFFAGMMEAETRRLNKEAAERKKEAQALGKKIADSVSKPIQVYDLFPGDAMVLRETESGRVYARIKCHTDPKGQKRDVEGEVYTHGLSAEAALKPWQQWDEKKFNDFVLKHLLETGRTIEHSCNEYQLWETMGRLGEFKVGVKQDAEYDEIARRVERLSKTDPRVGFSPAGGDDYSSFWINKSTLPTGELLEDFSPPIITGIRWQVYKKGTRLVGESDQIAKKISVSADIDPDTYPVMFPDDPFKTIYRVSKQIIKWDDHQESPVTAPYRQVISGGCDDYLLIAHRGWWATIDKPEASPGQRIEFVSGMSGKILEVGTISAIDPPGEFHGPKEWERFRPWWVIRYAFKV